MYKHRDDHVLNWPPETLDIIVRGIESLLEELEHEINLEKRYPPAKEACFPRKIISWIVIQQKIATRILETARESHTLFKNDILQYQKRIQRVKDKTREITIRENLGGK